MTSLVRSLAFAAPASFTYLVLIPLACGYLDRKFKIGEFVPRGLQLPGALLLLAGAAVAIWTFFLFAFVGHGTPNPLAPPQHLVQVGPYRYSRNPMMLGGWIAGFGLGLLLRSPAFLLFCCVVVFAGAAYVVVIEEPSLVRRFGAAYSDYCRSTPRWLGRARIY
jgi:protein-S-isoprenylcysteine O-methyltransferase Ste14